MDRAARERRRRAALEAHGVADVLLLALLIAVWAVTSRGYFWPMWVLLALALALAIHGWFVFLGERPDWATRHFRSRALAGFAGVCGGVSSCT